MNLLDRLIGSKVGKIHDALLCAREPKDSVAAQRQKLGPTQ